MVSKKNPELEIGRNSSLYFAIGLNLMLLLTWRALEFKTYEKEEVDVGIVSMDAQVEEDIPIVTMRISTPPPPPPPTVIQENIEIVEDEVEVEETVFESTETNQNDAIVEKGEVVGIGDVRVEAVEEEVEVAFAIIEDVPVFPGCEGLSKEATKKCFEKKVQKHVVDNFNYPEDALSLGIQGRVSVLFIIDNKGLITNVRSRGPDKILEKEAERIIKLLPKMKPGMQRGRPVKVAYAVPIFFKMGNG
ncbi:energy transducer TonB [Siansivirga zeaxanthinifaciens]|uniref:Energy transducer TonB n=1 Tax=Siansivirga zeaxanthinifaciens CC-SAMT-1 TaxID=1454006 RepID=A0A0C5WEZ0_9FLAO|nr:energy transducer TonB [Siansivirga zeaxanthinifaciens]AJR03769.1 energy transducer TonB [Siansivirga zeaxanthinifaciens CC-SAMT-1]